MKTLSLLGSTGSIGTQTLDVLDGLYGTENAYRVGALAAHSNVRLLEEQTRRWHPDFVAVYEKGAAKAFREAVRDLPVRVGAGMDGLLEAAGGTDADMVLNAVVGMVGLQPTLTALAEKKTVALANKETLVTGGKLVMQAAKDNGVAILPVDSEHSAIFQCLEACKEKKTLQKLILTASGGPFFGKTREEIAGMTPAQALKHPSWNMGAKVTIDSATMMNKGLEIMEAAWLFDMEEKDIDVVVHRESVVHSLIQFADHSVLAQLGVPDMRLPIQYALTYPDRVASREPELDLAAYGKLTFYHPDEEVFVCPGLCREALRRGNLVPTAVNGANEAAVQLFLQGKIGFTDIPELVREAMERQDAAEEVTLAGILEADAQARTYVYENH